MDLTTDTAPQVLLPRPAVLQSDAAAGSARVPTPSNSTGQPAPVDRFEDARSSGSVAREQKIPDYRYLWRRGAEVIARLPQDPIRIFQAIHNADATALIIADETALAMEQERGDRTTGRYEAAMTELNQYLASTSVDQQASYHLAMGVMQHYVQAGENLDPDAPRPVSARPKKFYETLNGEVLAAGSMQKFGAEPRSESAKYFFEKMVPANRALPKLQGVLFRGGVVDATKAKALLDGTTRTFEWLPPMSTSVSVADAFKFLNPTIERINQGRLSLLPDQNSLAGLDPKGRVPTLFIIEGEGAPISTGTSFAFEEEALIVGEHGNRFEVKKAFMGPIPRAEESDPQVLYLVLKQIRAR